MQHNLTWGWFQDTIPLFGDIFESQVIISIKINVMLLAYCKQEIKPQL